MNFLRSLEIINYKEWKEGKVLKGLVFFRLVGAREKKAWEEVWTGSGDFRGIIFLKTKFINILS